MQRIISPKTIIVFPDDGSNKRFGQFFPTHKKIVCSKVREGLKRTIRIVDQINFPSELKENAKFSDVEYDKIVIVDDLVQSGGTLDECRKALEGYGFKNICAYATHSIFPNDTWKKFTSNNSWTQFYTTNTVPEVTNKLENISPFKILKLFGELEYEPMIIYVSSHNQQKLKAVYDAFANHFETNKLVVLGLNVGSGIPEQPFGKEQTEQGCANRLDTMIKYLQAQNIKYDYCVSLENGLELSTNSNSNQCVQDFCVGKILSVKYELPLTHSTLNFSTETRVIIPHEYYLECVNSNQTETIGKIISRKTGIPLDSFHQFYNSSRLTRVEIMNELVESMLFTFAIIDAKVSFRNSS